MSFNKGKYMDVRHSINAGECVSFRNVSLYLYSINMSMCNIIQ